MVRRVGLGSASQWTIYRDITQQSTTVITQSMFVFAHESCVCVCFLTKVVFVCVYKDVWPPKMCLTNVSRSSGGDCSPLHTMGALQ